MLEGYSHIPCSCHERDTAEGDTFGGLGTSREFKDEDIERVREEYAKEHESYEHSD